MDTAIIKQGLRSLLGIMPEILPPTGWYLSDNIPSNAFFPEKDRWTCLFRYYSRLVDGEMMCFSKDRTGCSGASCYLGFSVPSKNAPHALVDKERFKKHIEYGTAFYEGIQTPDITAPHVVWAPLSEIADGPSIEVVNLWLNATQLADLVTLANYDRSSNDNVMIPFASGCQSIWTIPYKEKDAAQPKCVVGSVDPAMRHHLPSDILSFSMPANRFVEMMDNIPGSFLDPASERAGA